MLTIQMLTKNNGKTVGKAIESVAPLNGHLVIGDLGSTDNTLNICEAYGAEIINLGDMPRNEARNSLTGDEINMYIEPWETLAQGHQEILNIKETSYATILQGSFLRKEIRFWRNETFANPVFESIRTQTDKESAAIFFSTGDSNMEHLLTKIEDWKLKTPLDPRPYYFQASILLSQQKHKEFIKIAEHYLFVEKDKDSMSATMIRYYYAMVQLTHMKKAKPALQNLNLCLCKKPLMAEFWCLMGDVYYHLLKKYQEAKEFYENAMILGSRRLKTDKWPMDLKKYSEYPQKMIESCEKITSSHSLYVQ